jgi:hypothetical protein
MTTKGPLMWTEDELRQQVKAELEAQRFSCESDGWREKAAPAAAIESLTKQLLALDDRLRAAYRKWYEEGKLELSVVAGGFTIDDLRARLPRSCVSGLFAWMNALLADPVRTALRIQDRASHPKAIIIDAEPFEK